MTELTTYQKSKIKSYERDIRFYQSYVDRGQANYQNNVDNLTKQLENYKTKLGLTVAGKDAQNYIELKVGEITVKKSGKSMTISMNSTCEYTDFNIKRIKDNLSNAFDVVEAASKYESSDSAAAVEI
jgi:hypothetical protein